MARCRLRPTEEDAAIMWRTLRGTHERCHALQVMLGGDDTDYALFRGRELHKVACIRAYGISPSWAAIARMEMAGGSLARCLGNHIQAQSI